MVRETRENGRDLPAPTLGPLDCMCALMQDPTGIERQSNFIYSFYKAYLYCKFLATSAHTMVILTCVSTLYTL